MDWQSFIVGVLVALLVTLIFREMYAARHFIFYQVRRYLWIVYFAFMFCYYVIKANLDVVYRVVHPKMPIRPGIVKVKTTLKTHTALTALCNSITLTPGTLSVDLDHEGGYIYIHWINVQATDIDKTSEMIVGRFEKILHKALE